MTLPALAAFLICLATEADAPEFISDGFKRAGRDMGPVTPAPRLGRDLGPVTFEYGIISYPSFQI